MMLREIAAAMMTGGAFVLAALVIKLLEWWVESG